MGGAEKGRAGGVAAQTGDAVPMVKNGGANGIMEMTGGLAGVGEGEGFVASDVVGVSRHPRRRGPRSATGVLVNDTADGSVKVVGMGGGFDGPRDGWDALEIVADGGKSGRVGEFGSVKARLGWGMGELDRDSEAGGGG